MSIHICAIGSVTRFANGLLCSGINIFPIRALFLCSNPTVWLGLLYWYAVKPFRRVVFEGMLAGIQRDAVRIALASGLDGQKPGNVEKSLPGNRADTGRR